MGFLLTLTHDAIGTSLSPHPQHPERSASDRLGCTTLCGLHFVRFVMKISFRALALVLWSFPGFAVAADPPTLWSQLTPSGGPGNRAHQLGVVDSANNRLITFGGMSGSGKYR